MLYAYDFTNSRTINILCFVAGQEKEEGREDRGKRAERTGGRGEIIKDKHCTTQSSIQQPIFL